MRNHDAIRSCADILAFLSRLDREEIDARNLLKEIEEERTVMQRFATVDMVREFEVRCSYCARTTTLHRWTFIQAEYYVPPRGCIEGDFMRDCSIEQCLIRCPECEMQMRIARHIQRHALQLFLNRRACYLQSIFDLPIETLRIE